MTFMVIIVQNLAKITGLNIFLVESFTCKLFLRVK